MIYVIQFAIIPKCFSGKYALFHKFILPKHTLFPKCLKVPFYKNGVKYMGRQEVCWSFW